MESPDILARIEDDLSVSDDAMRSIPESSTAINPEPFGPVIDAYTRADAIADGTLVAVPEPIAREAGLRAPVAITRAAWTDCVEWSDTDSNRQTPQDEEGRLWDVLFMTAFAARRHTRTPFPVELYRVPRGGRARTARLIELTCRFHQGDGGEPVITISLPDED
ncbi:MULTISPECIES: DUF6573 family protein [unclassified Streptomyces]|uniref:DUF6573 family protein n=1 Tax=unclassified Streptomyces TaxID=2593676 RepID=UPI0035DCBB92